MTAAPSFSAAWRAADTQASTLKETSATRTSGVTAATLTNPSLIPASSVQKGQSLLHATSLLS